MEEKKTAFRDRDIVVVGIARSGAGAANLLAAFGARVTAMDKKPSTLLREAISRISPSVRIITDGTPAEIMTAADMIVISPGVPLTLPQLQDARSKGVPVIGELELAYQALISDELGELSMGSGPGSATSASSPFPAFIGITGTNGKSTTTMLVDQMIRASGRDTLLGGNIGISLTEELLKLLSVHDAGGAVSSIPRCHIPSCIVAEISSFQLETIQRFRPNVALLLNITPDHLDRYTGMEEYAAAKARIFENQTAEDILILNADDPVVMEVEKKGLMERKLRSKVLYFSMKKEVPGAYFRDGVVKFDLPGTELLPAPFTLSPSDIRIQGVHNIENAMAASLAALVAGSSPDDIRNVLRSFPGLEHRIEYAGEVGGVRFINDSKGTNIGAVAKSLEGFESVVLIMGGLDKGSDFSVLREAVRRKVRALVLIGKAREKIAAALGDTVRTHMADDLRSAVRLALSKASAGDVVLLSPGCASFDMFVDFEDRGRKFKEAVRELMA